MFEHVVDSLPEVNKPLSAKYKKSFGYPTFKERIPNILNGIIKGLNKDEIQLTYGEEAAKEVDDVVEKIRCLISSMICDEPLVPVNANGIFAKEVAIYNKLIEEKTVANGGNPPTWFQTEWLFAECYLYFKLHEIFYVSNGLKKYDPFLVSKVDTLLQSHNAITALCQFLFELKKLKTNEIDTKDIFEQFLMCALWGNKADLSLSEGVAVGTNENLMTKKNEWLRLILINHMEDVYGIVKSGVDEIDIVLDNAGYELFNDLCFADFLLWSGLVKKVIFHGKLIPWFVSDVTAHDFDVVFKLLKDNIDSKEVQSTVNDWNKYTETGQWSIKCESFWITPYDFSYMKSEDPELYGVLAKSPLVIFKGDLNYRKLMGDIYWEPTTSFLDALRGFTPTNVLSLRTVKADTICGLPKGLFEKLNDEDPGWMITGKYGLIQLLKKND